MSSRRMKSAIEMKFFLKALNMSFSWLKLGFFTQESVVIHFWSRPQLQLQLHHWGTCNCKCTNVIIAQHPPFSISCCTFKSATLPLLLASLSVQMQTEVQVHRFICSVFPPPPHCNSHPDLLFSRNLYWEKALKRHFSAQRNVTF